MIILQKSVYMGRKEYRYIDTESKELFDINVKARALTKEYSQTNYDNLEKKEAILKELFGSIGKNVAIDVNFFCDFGSNIFIGDDVIINSSCTFIDNEKIIIGNKVLIAPNVQIYTAYHPLLPEQRIIEKKEGSDCYYTTCADPVEIKDGVWIGGGVIILPGVTIGENSVIGAGSVVTRSIPDNCVAVGNPCRVIKFFDDIRKENNV